MGIPIQYIDVHIYNLSFLLTYCNSNNPERETGTSKVSQDEGKSTDNPRQKKPPI